MSVCVCVFSYAFAKGKREEREAKKKKRDGVHVSDMSGCLRMTACICVYVLGHLSVCMCISGELSVSEEQGWAAVGRIYNARHPSCKIKPLLLWQLRHIDGNQDTHMRTHTYTRSHSGGARKKKAELTYEHAILLKDQS